jgi:serine/threonine protein phosphatase 1
VTEIAFIGDIHGCLGPLEEVLDIVLTRTRNLVFLGDYVNRGNQSAQVIDRLIALSTAPSVNARFVRGNHDQEMLNVLNGVSLDTFLRMGGASTVRSYVEAPFNDVEARFRRSVSASHRKFLESLETEIETVDWVASHKKKEICSVQQFSIAGHHAQPTTLPSITSANALVDTGCGTLKDGRLTALFWPSLEWVQSAPWH